MSKVKRWPLACCALAALWLTGCGDTLVLVSVPGGDGDATIEGNDDTSADSGDTTSDDKD